MAPDHTLPDILRSFDRKERNWLLRNATGSVPLSFAFRRLVGGTLQAGSDYVIPETAWWAIDYHLDWLAAALMRFASETPPYERDPSCPYASNGLVTGTQEDVDLIVAFETTVVLIEAKGDTAWSTEQFARKRRRIEAIRAIAVEGVRLHHVLLSPRNTRLANGSETAGAVPWISLDVPDAKHLWRVVPCDGRGNTMKGGSHFRIV